MPKFLPQLLENATWLIRDSLNLKPSSKLLIVYDESTSDVLRLIKEAASELSVEPVEYFITEGDYRQANESDDPIPEALRNHIASLSSAVFFQERSTLTNSFRLKFLSYIRKQPGRRAASMPGVSIDNFDLVCGDLDQIKHDCWLFAERLLWCRDAKLTSFDSDGNAYELTMKLGNNDPLPSTGKVPNAGWCNVPSGETFIVPDRGTANGDLIVNGSVLGHVCGPREHVKIKIVDGLAISAITNPPTGKLRDAVSRLLLTTNDQPVCENCNVLSELGIGLNHAVSRFTGIPLFDEKKRGTVHIGFGNSSHFGGDTICTMHNDFVVSSGRLYLDESLVVSGGRVLLSDENCKANWRNIERKFLNENVIWLSSEFAEKKLNGQLIGMRSWNSDRMGNVETQIGDDETARIALTILWSLQEAGGQLRPAELRELWISNTNHVESFYPTLELLLRFNIIEQEK